MNSLMTLLFPLLAMMLLYCSSGESSGEAKNKEAVPPSAKTDLPIDKINLPEGFKIEVFAEGLDGARSMTISPSGTLYIGTRGAGNIYAVPDAASEGFPKEGKTIATGLNSPNGVAWHDDALYVAEISRVLRYSNIKGADKLPEPEVVNDKFPDDKHHGWKYIAFGPDDKLYVPVGAPCNICKSEDEIFATITRMDADGSNHEIFAEGIRNTVGFDWHPSMGELWFTDNGGDNLGDNRPPDELNRAPEKGMHFGYPYCHGGDMPDPAYGNERPCSEFTPPAKDLGPHVAALGMKFYTGEMFPEEYHGQIFIAEHGSWNRTVPIGYRIMLVRLENGKAVSYTVFAEGWLQDNGEAWGRPVDVLVMPDGALLVSDDKAGAVYRISSE